MKGYISENNNIVVSMHKQGDAIVYTYALSIPEIKTFISNPSLDVQ